MDGDGGDRGQKNRMLGLPLNAIIRARASLATQIATQATQIATQIEILFNNDLDSAQPVPDSMMPMPAMQSPRATANRPCNSWPLRVNLRVNPSESK